MKYWQHAKNMEWSCRMIKFKYAEAPLRELGEIAEMMSGMSGVSNKWASDGNCKFIDYLNVLII